MNGISGKGRDRMEWGLGLPGRVQGFGIQFVPDDPDLGCEFGGIEGKIARMKKGRPEWLYLTTPAVPVLLDDESELEFQAHGETTAQQIV